MIEGLLFLPALIAIASIHIAEGAYTALEYRRYQNRFEPNSGSEATLEENLDRIIGGLRIGLAASPLLISAGYLLGRVLESS